MKDMHRFMSTAIILALLLASAPVQSAGAVGVLYAKPTISGTGDCSSWANACTLRTAMSGEVPGSWDEIWAMEGTHKPTSGTNRTATFQLVSGVAVYGGFDGTETSRDERDPAANPTILSGDLNGDDGADFANNGDNSYHVVTGSGTDATAILDGFTIQGGNANGGYPNDSGGGMYNDSGSPILTNVTLSGNQADIGGGMYNEDGSNPSLTNVTFSGNWAVEIGGGMTNRLRIEGESAPTPSLMNVTFSGNQATTSGGGMYNWDSSPVLTYVTFSDNQADRGGGMSNEHSSDPSLTNVTLSGNQATTLGGGMFNYSLSNPSLTNVTLSGNQATWGGGMYNENNSPSLTNVTLSGNQADAGGGMHNESSSPSLTNVTISGNQATTLGGGMYNDASTLSLTNVIIADSFSGGDCVNSTSSLNLAWANNLIEDAANACGLLDGDNGNMIGSDPNLGPLANYGGWTETQALQPGSPAIDAVTIGGCPVTDQRGVARPQGSQCDIGAYEFYTGIYYAKPAASGAGNCSSWADACSLQDALNWTNSGDEIWAMAGTHIPTTTDTDPRTATFQLVSGVGVYGGFDGTESSRDERDPAANPTILSGDLNGDDTGFTNTSDNSYHVVTGSGTDSSAILDGFTIRGGNANESYPDDSGGGMYNLGGSPSLSNLTFNGNWATLGGGMTNNASSPSLTNVTLSGNQATTGGGMFNDSSSPSLENVILSGNQAGEYGGGMFNYESSPILTNVTLSGNQADGGGGIFNTSNSNPSLTNVTLSGNTATVKGGGIFNAIGTLSVTDSTFSGNSATQGGGIYNSSADGDCADAPATIITNSTFSGNSATDGGGMYNYNGVISLLFNTITANSATDGGGIRSYNDDVTCTKSGSNIISNNTGDDLSAVFADDNTMQRFYSLGYNLIGVAGANVDFTQEFNQPGDQTGVTDPMLTPLANNGGPTLTHALQPGSPAIEAGTNSDCPVTDQRGKPRPDDGDLDGTATCDIGAVEFQRAPITTRLRSQKTYDGWVLESSELSGKGGTKNNAGKVLQVGDDAGDKQYRTILSFGTGSLPDRAVITKVILKVKKAGVTGSNPMMTHSGLVVDIKKNRFSTSAKLQNNDFQAKANKLKAGKFAKKLYSGWYKAVLYKGAYAYINVKGLTQLRLRFLLDDNDDNAANILKLYSGNAGLAKRPQLIVEYYVP